MNAIIVAPGNKMSVKFFGQCTGFPPEIPGSYPAAGSY